MADDDESANCCWLLLLLLLTPQLNPSSPRGEEGSDKYLAWKLLFISRVLGNISLGSLLSLIPLAVIGYGQPGNWKVDVRV